MFNQQQEGLGARLRHHLALFGNLRAICLSGVLIAMSIVLGKFLQIPNPFQQVLRISFENLPVLMAGITMGPFIGGAVGVVADLLGCVLYGYSINPIVTLGALAVGFVSGAVAHYAVRSPLAARVIAATTLAHLLGSVVIKTAGLAAWYLARYEIGLGELMLWRLLNYLLIGTAECVLLFVLLRHRGLSQQLERMLKK